MRGQKNIAARILTHMKRMGQIHVNFGIPLSAAKPDTLVLFPDTGCTLGCGICALVAFKGPACEDDLQALSLGIEKLAQNRLGPFTNQRWQVVTDDYLGGKQLLSDLFDHAQNLKQESVFSSLYYNREKTRKLARITEDIENIISQETRDFKTATSSLATPEVEIASDHIELVKDILWCLKKEVLENIGIIENLAPWLDKEKTPWGLILFKRINAVLNSIDRLEVRGRDSAGISVLCTLEASEFSDYRAQLEKQGLAQDLEERTNRQILTNNTISVNKTSSSGSAPDCVTISFVYKFAAEVGALGDNVSFIREQIKNDSLLQTLAKFTLTASSVSAHTRWASVGDITEANCHPVDNAPTDTKATPNGIIHVCLNGDIDNYLELKTEYEARYDKIHPQITTDTKLIPLQVEHHLKSGAPIEEAFRLAVNEFQGSHAISMHTDLAPGKLFLAQKGSGQAIFVGIAKDHYIAASELYGVVEETRSYIKLNGEDQGQIVILDQNGSGGVEGIRSFYYDSQPITITQDDVLTSQITSRDIDRQGFNHYFLKEISESPLSVEKTLENKFKQNPGSGLFNVSLNQTIIPLTLEQNLRSGKIKKIYFIGQGTAGIAAQGCADILRHYLGEKAMDIRAQKASELSGFSIRAEGDNCSAMEDTLVVAISQSGTTTDTNRTVDMIKACGAKTIAIVNRRDSDLTFKVDGVLYTSSGRDIEMSVASTKAFYSQITAGAVLGLHLAALLNARTQEYISDQIRCLMDLPAKMTAVLDIREQIKACASQLAVTKNYWATVGSGFNKTSADEIRIKLSELCYKTISSDFVEDKKHIDLSSEPLIIVCAAGTRESVLGDIIKDTAIFHAHKACPIVITTEGEDRFDIYARAVFKIPQIPEHFAPILNTLVGHIWGYYAALAINSSSKFLYDAKMKFQGIIDDFKGIGHDDYEVLLEDKFRESVAGFYNQFSEKRREDGFPGALGLNAIANITLLLKYLSGRLPVSDFEIDFGVKGTPANMLSAFFTSMNQAINNMARPVDAIKHQAKTVTVGTSRISESFEGILFDSMAEHDIQLAQLTHNNVIVVKNLQEIVCEIKGAVFYRISGLSLLGGVTSDTRIEVLSKTGNLANESSRVETDHRLKGTKNIIVREGNVYIGKGRKDNRNILVIPVLSTNPATPNSIEFLLSLNIGFKSSEDVSLLKKIKALGGKYTRLKDWILESTNVTWDDKYLNLVDIDTLFGATAEKAVDAIIKKLN